jgi:DNA-binding CsgD family transcriptional regulator
MHSATTEHPPHTRSGPLTARELEIMRHIMCGQRTKEITRELGVSYHTVKTHLANIRRKAGAGTMMEAVKWYYFTYEINKSNEIRSAGNRGAWKWQGKCGHFVFRFSSCSIQ